MRAWVLVFVALSGCFAGCGPTPGGANWFDPAFYDAVDVDPFAARGMDWDTSGLDAPWNQSRVLGVGRSLAEGSLAVYAGRIDVTVEGNETAVVDEAMQRLAQLGLPDEEVPALREALLASYAAEEDHRHDEGYVRVARLSTSSNASWFSDLRSAWDAGGEAVLPVHGFISRGPWRFDLDFPQKEISLDGGMLVVDAAGNVDYSRSWPENTPGQVVLADINATLAAAGLPRPEQVELMVSIC